MHPIWQIASQETKTDEEKVMLNAIIELSVTVFTSLTFEQIYDELLEGRQDTMNSGFISRVAVKAQLNQLKEITLNTQTGLQRTQADVATLQGLVAAMQDAIVSSGKAQTEANARFAADIAALRNLSGSGDNDALNALADSMEVTLKQLQSSTDQLTAAAVAEAAVDLLTITPSTLSTSRATKTVFSSNDPKATFKATNGTVDVIGTYTPPIDINIMADTVTATSSDGTQTATCSVTIVG